MTSIPLQIGNELFDEWNHTTLENEEMFEYLNGLWKGKKPPFINAKVLRNTNFNNDGTLSLVDVAELPVEEKQFRTRKLMIGDILLERSGGGPKQPVGRVVYFDLPQEDYSFSNFTTCIRVKDNKSLNAEFLLYYLLSFYNKGKTNELQQRTTGIRNLNFADYKKIKIPLPVGQEQESIVVVLSKIHHAIEQQEKTIEKTKELKRSLMHRLFTYGLRGEELKETEIGLMPERWSAKRLKDVVEKTSQRGMTKTPDIQFKYIDVSSISNESLKIIGSTTYKGSEAPSRARKIVRVNDVLFATVRPTLKRIAYVGNEFDGEICSTAFCVLRSSLELSGKYLYYCVQRDSFIENLGKLQRGANYPAVTDGNVKDQLIPFPTIEEQKDIADVLLGIDSKIDQETRKMDMLKGLFKSMLQLLMTGQVRVKDIDFGEINV
jgi:type I restriction enzyme S subunit